jgi:hypothetical protein
MYTSIVLFVAFTILQVLMYQNKVQRNMFWYVNLAFVIGNLTRFSGMLFLKGVRSNCSLSAPNTALNIYTALFIMTYHGSGLIFNLAVWHLVYKYWDVSWTISILLKGEDVTQNMRKWLNCGFITGIVTFTVIYAAYSIYFGIVWNQDDDYDCFLKNDLLRNDNDT